MGGDEGRMGMKGQGEAGFMLERLWYRKPMLLPERNPGEAVAEIHRWLAAAITAVAGELGAVEPGRLVNLSLPLPTEGADLFLAGDSSWRSPNDGQRIDAFGEAACFGSDAARRFEVECRRWHPLGVADAPPLAFFTVPPATAPALPRIRVPRIALRTCGGDSIVTFGAWWSGGSPETITRGWLIDVGRIGVADTEPGRQEPLHILSTETEPSAAIWERRVRRASRAVAEGRLAKLVLARRLSLELSRPADPARLADALARLNPECCVFSLPCGSGQVIAASPELLAVKRGERLVSHALAGTAKRHDGPAETARAAGALMASAKERLEHALVVKAIANSLAELCEEVESLPEPVVLPLRFVQHLWTPLAGRLQPGVGQLDAVARLHPTPAVLGSPPQEAVEWLRDIGERRDGLYTGVVGWIDGDGDAAVVLRSAYLEDRTAVLWAGAGIMADSDPHAEFAETELKLASLMEVINAPMTGAAALASRLDSSGLVKQRNASGTLERPVQQTLG